MKKLVMGLTVLSVLASCSSGSKSEPAKEERTFKKDYVLVDGSDKILPDWIDAPEQGDVSKERKNNRYFINESANVEKRLCLRSAEARATARIAAEIAQFMKNTYAEATQNAEDDANEYMEEQLAQEAQSFIVGSSVLKTYWEKRAYKEELGAEEDHTTFNCFALVKMSKKNLEKAIKQSRAKLLGEIEDPEVKKKAERALKDVEGKFNELNKRVNVEMDEE